MDLTPHQDFEGKRTDEKVVVCVHRHWLFLLPDILITLALALVPVLVLVLVSLAGGLPFEGNARAVTAVALPAWYLTVVTFFFIRWLDYYLDLAIVTDERVVDVDQYGLFRRNVAELHFDAVQDVTVHRAGILPTLFNFGDVEVQTAGERLNFTFRAVPRPDDIVRIITEEQSQDRKKEEKTTEELAQAAEKMSEAAEKIQDETVEPKAEPTGEPAASPNPPADEPAPAPKDPPDGDLPKEYER